MSIQDKLQELRIRWKNEPQNRSIIEEQVKILKLGERFPKYTKPEDPFISNVKKALG